MRNGRTTNTPRFTNGRKNEARSQTFARLRRDSNYNNGLHEQWMWYDKCNNRDRNKGNLLF